ncbi:unnamed protein product [Diatraea saccharalis]|uniref:Seroin transcript 1A n=1 Tax=Diatraea saccharalis TaxID=40085 RepID=A0A9N9RFE1_9NEOP|nr:unnamed protein product [Diatraea saccharalis]
MALTTILIVCIVAAANAGYVWVSDGASGYSPFQSSFRMPGMTFPPPPPPPPMPMFGPGFPFNYVNFPKMPDITFPPIPTAEDIENAKPGPNGVYNGVVVRSSSSIIRGENGKPLKYGGSTILVNDNGDVHKESYGNDPPNLNDPMPVPSVISSS